jgi:Fe-S-cluster containining protein
MCCNEPEVISITMLDLWHLAERFHSKPMRMAKKYCKRHPTVKTAWAFKKVKPCAFYDAERRGCRIYNNRPEICRAYPFISQLWDEGQIKIYPGCKGCQEMIEEFNLKVVDVIPDEKGGVLPHFDEERPAVLPRGYPAGYRESENDARQYNVRALRNTGRNKASKGSSGRGGPSGVDGL